MVLMDASDQVVLKPIDYYLVTSTGRPVHLMPGSDYEIGRGEGMTVRIPDSLLSRHHCTLYWDANSHWYLRDEASRNGTYLDGHRIDAPLRLKDHSRILLGGQTFTYRELPAGADPAQLRPTVAFSEAPTFDPQEGSLADLLDMGNDLKGSLVVTPLKLVLQLLHEGRTSGIMEFDAQPERWIEVVEGDPKYAAYDHLRGRDALAKIEAAAVTFAFRSDAPSRIPESGYNLFGYWS